MKFNWLQQSLGIAKVSAEDNQGIHINHEQSSDPDIKIEPTKDSNHILNSTLIRSIRFAHLFYITSGIFILFSLVMMLNTYVLHLKIETAVVSTPIEAMVAPVGGYISKVFVKPGDRVKQGNPLLKVENIDLERELQLARVTSEESNLNVAYYQQLLANEQQRLKIYKKIGHTRVISSQAMVNVSEQERLKAQHNLARFTELHKKNYVSEANLEAEQTKYLNAVEQLTNAKAHHRLEHHALKAINQGMYFTGTKAEGIEQDLFAELKASQQKAKLNADRVNIYELLISKLILRAPFDAKVTQILKSAGNTTDNIKPIIFIENISMNKNIIAYLTQDEIIHIGSSRQVKIFIPSSGKTYRGDILEINRTDGFIDEVKAQYRWRNFQVDRSAMVTISVREMDQNDFNQHAFSGMPAIVYFSKSLHYFR
jgi:multidrug resistance efflux pump